MSKCPPFIWPKPRLSRAVLGSVSRVSQIKVEARLKEMFPSGTPVLCSSGRAALALWTRAQGFGRTDAVSIFPFASHCVHDALSRYTCPVEIEHASATAKVNYHQWGYLFPGTSSILDIDDCVDTLCIPETPLFPSGAGAEIWSLNKIFGTVGGGVLWCADNETALRVKDIQDGLDAGMSLWLRRLVGTQSSLSYMYWEGAEASFGKPHQFQLGEIWKAISDWNALVEDRKSKLAIAERLTVPGVKLRKGRLPTCVPADVGKFHLPDAQALGFAAETRHFPVSGDGGLTWKSVFPVPIHQDVGFENLEKLAKQSESESR